MAIHSPQNVVLASTSAQVAPTLHLVPGTGNSAQAASQTALSDPKHSGTTAFIDLAVIAGRRCSSFFAEAAVLVLVFGILDFFILKGRIEMPWIIGALGISLGLLAASIATDFCAHRWIKNHP